MATYLLRRLLLGCVTLVAITVVVYGLARNMPGNPLTAQFGEDPSRRITAEDYARMQRAYGLDQSWPEGYLQWSRNLLRGDLGRSITRKQPVTTLIGERIGPTLLISGTAFLLIWLAAVPLGLYASARSGRPDERIVSLVLYALYSFPTFVAALFLQVVFAVWSRGTAWELPLFGMTDLPPDAPLGGRILDVARHMVLPVICQTYVSLAYDIRFIRANMEEAVRQDYIRTARAKGAGPWRVLFHHAFRNTLIPLVTLLGLSLPSLIGGSIIIEQIFTWPGMGRLFFESIRERDYPTIMGLTLMFSVLTLLGQLLADLLYCLVDPRVSVD
ncbi:MAG: ABC transporter permease [Planctomycetota bacterium]|jgi:peptide/nickel transport system permease protein|nr:MAG: ABC transporter permease [Planctomycetota bacterium]RLT19926.1 MAG: ABC transporter permease [Planctomycetota bacterium]